MVSTTPTADQAAAYLDYVQPLVLQLFPAFFKLAAIQPGERVLDLGCGPGESTLEAAQRAGPLGEVVGIDQSPAFVELARARASAAGVRNVRFEVMRAESLDLAASYWDVVISHLAIAEFDDVLAALREVLRVLRPVGRLAVATWGEPERSPWLAIPYAAAHTVSPVHPPATAARLFRFGAAGVLSRLLADNGFADVTPDRASASVAYDDLDQYWQSIEAGLAYVGGPLAGLSAAQRATAMATAETELRKWRHPRSRQFQPPVQAFLGVAVK